MSHPVASRVKQMRKGKRVLQMKRVQIMRLSNLQFSCAPFSNILSNFIEILETLEMNKRNSLHRTGDRPAYEYCTSINIYSHTYCTAFFIKNISNEETLFFLIAQSLKKLIFAVSNIRGNAQVALQIRFSTLIEEL